MLWTNTNSLKGLNLGLMNIHRGRALIGPFSARRKPIGDAEAVSQQADKVKENLKTSHLRLTGQRALYDYHFYIIIGLIYGNNSSIKSGICHAPNKQHFHQSYSCFIWVASVMKDFYD